MQVLEILSDLKSGISQAEKHLKLLLKVYKKSFGGFCDPNTVILGLYSRDMENVVTVSKVTARIAFLINLHYMIHYLDYSLKRRLYEGLCEDITINHGEGPFLTILTNNCFGVPISCLIYLPWGQCPFSIVY